MSSGTRRTANAEAAATAIGGRLATRSQPMAPPRILVVDAWPPHWAETCPKLCQALEHVFCLACSLQGPPRIPLFSVYVAQNQQECLLPFVPVKGSFARLQSCFAELRAVPAEGVFHPKEDAVVQAVQDGLLQFKQYTGRGMAGAPLSSCTIEITVLTMRHSNEVAQRLEAGLQGTDLVSLRQLQVAEITRGELQEEDEPWPEASGEVDLQKVDNDVVALEGFFKTWLLGHSTDREHLHLLLPARPLGLSASRRGSLACLKCDLQERLLSPALLPLLGAGDNGAWANNATAGCFWMAPGLGLALHQLRVLRALKAEGVCASVFFGLPLIVRPTSCWQLNWDELETNQHHFQALCHGLRNQELLLLAQYEPQEEPSPHGEPPTTVPVASHWVLLPTASCSSLLLRSVAPRELLLPGAFHTHPVDPPEAALREMKSILEGLEVEPAFNPLCLGTQIYRTLRTSLAQPLVPRPPLRPAEQHLPRQQAGQRHASRARATVAPLRLNPTSGANRVALSLFSSEEEEFLDAP